MGNEFEKEIPWPSWQSIWSIWFDMDCDGMKEYVNKLFRPSKIDQVLNFYGIPYIYKNEYKKYLKYRIQPRHYDVVQHYFMSILSQEWYDTSDFNYWKLQDEYNIKIPVAEQTALDLHVNYQEFLQKDKEHREAVLRQQDSVKDEQIQNMQAMMQTMMSEMWELKKLVWQPNVLLSNKNINEWWTTTKETPLETTTETRPTEQSEWWVDSSWWEQDNWSNKWDWLWIAIEPFRIPTDWTWTETETKKNRRSA